MSNSYNAYFHWAELPYHFDDGLFDNCFFDSGLFGNGLFDNGPFDDGPVVTGELMQDIVDELMHKVSLLLVIITPITHHWQLVSYKPVVTSIVLDHGQAPINPIHVRTPILNRFRSSLLNLVIFQIQCSAHLKNLAMKLRQGE